MPDTGVKEEKSMKKKTVNYSSEKLGEIKVIEDFLPSPEKLGFKEEKEKVTLELSKNSVEFFKKHAKEQKTHYQAMIRDLLDKYTEHHTD